MSSFHHSSSDDNAHSFSMVGTCWNHHGLSKMVDEVCGSPAFMAPEMVLRQGYEFKARKNHENPLSRLGPGQNGQLDQRNR